MWIPKKEIKELSYQIKSSSNGAIADIRDNKEGEFSVLKDDIYNLVNRLGLQISQTEVERDSLAEYMADISHQLKTPITSMLIMVDLLEEAEPEKRTEFIRGIKMSLTKMEWLVSTLLKMSKLDAGAVTFSKKKVKMSEILAETRSSLEILLDIKNQNIQIENDFEIICDKRWTAEAMTNILKNAIEHSREGSSIVVTSGTNPLYDWIGITDSGEGMSKEQIAALYNRFENSTSENGYGIGVPLALSIMRGQSGDIDIEPNPEGTGTMFTLKLYH